MEALRLQRELARRVQAGEHGWWLFCEHPSVYTQGRHGKRENLHDEGIEVIPTDRGGDVTWHGPGQLVVYCILPLERMHLGVATLVDRLEQTIIDVLRHYGIGAYADRQYRGVWVGEEKIAALGLHVGRGVTMHGLALNIDVDLAAYTAINPCGIVNRGVTSMHRIMCPPPALPEVAEEMVRAVQRRFGIRLAESAPADAWKPSGPNAEEARI